jgi:hypothetical protein
VDPGPVASISSFGVVADQDRLTEWNDGSHAVGGPFVAVGLSPLVAGALK